MSVVRARIIGLLIVIVVADVFVFPQDASTPAAAWPRIFIELPDQPVSDAVWIRYVLSEPGSTGAIVKTEPNLRRYVIDARIGTKPARHAKVIVYAAGCQFKTYAIDLDGASDISQHFRCDSLPSKTVHGFLPPSQIPSSRIFPNEKRIVISGEIEPDWICDFFLQQRLGPTVIAGGSCLESGIPLGKIGELDPVNAGAFDITIPDFARDPLFKATGDTRQVGDFGEIVLILQDNRIGRTLGIIKPQNAGQKSGLNIQSEYPNPMTFTTRQ